MKRVVARVVLVAFLSLTLFSCGGGGGAGTPGGSTGGPDTTAPTVSSTSSANGATGVAVNAAISVTFSEAMDASTVTATTFTVKAGSTAVTGTVSYSGTTATFTPTANLAYSTSYTVTVSTGAKDLAGNALLNNYVWNFTTGTASDTTPPTVSSTSPAGSATGVVVNAAITVIFSEPMDASTITTTTFTVKVGSTAVPGTVSYSGIVATFTPTDNLAYSTSYTATVTTGAKDLAGNALASNYVWNFTSSSTATTALPGPAPPPPPGTAAEQAAYYIALLASPETRLSGWLGLYDFLGVPVLWDGTPVGSTGDDPFGIPYWQVWYASGMELPGRGLPLSDAGGMLAFSFTGSDNAAYGPLLLDDLRSAARSTDPQVGVLGLFVRERILRGPLNADILDPAVLPTTAVIDIPTLQLIGWIAMRGALFQSAASESVASSPSRIVSRASRLSPKSSSTRGIITDMKCSETPLGWDEATAVAWIAKRFGGGLQYGVDKKLSSLIGIILKGKSYVDILNKGRNYLDILASAVSALLQYSAMEVTGEQNPDPLIRTKSCGADGDPGVISVKIAYNNGKIPDGAELEQCAISHLAAAFGVGFSFPKNGEGIPYAEVTIRAGTGMPEPVFFSPYKEENTVIRTTNAEGIAKINVMGAKQPICLNGGPDNYRVRPVKKEYSINVYSQAEGESDKSLATFYWDLAMAVTINRPNAIKALINYLKKIEFYGGSPLFNVRDWENVSSWKVVDPGMPIFSVSGVVCDLGEPFTVLFYNTAINTPFTYVFTPSSQEAGKVNSTATLIKDRLTVTWNGTGNYTVKTGGTDKVTISMTDQNVCVHTVVLSSGPGDPGTDVTNCDPGSDGDFDLVPFDTDSCSGA